MEVRVLEQAAPAGQQSVASAQGTEHLPETEAGDGIHAVRAAGSRGVVGQHGDRHLLTGLQNALVDGLQDGVVPRVGKAVVAAHDHLVLPAAHLVIHGQTVRCHPAHGVILEDHLPAVGPQPPPSPPGRGTGRRPHRPADAPEWTWAVPGSRSCPAGPPPASPDRRGPDTPRFPPR